MLICILLLFFQAEDGIRDLTVTGVQTCALPISLIQDECPREPYQERSENTSFHGLKRLEWAASTLGCPRGAGPNLPETQLNNQWFSKIAVWLVIALVLFTVFKQFDTRAGASAGHVGYSEFLEEVRSNRI